MPGPAVSSRDLLGRGQDKGHGLVWEMMLGMLQRSRWPGLCLWPGQDSWENSESEGSRPDLGLWATVRVSQKPGGESGAWEAEEERGHRPCAQLRNQSSEKLCLVQSRCRVNASSVWFRICSPTALPDDGCGEGLPTVAKLVGN